MNIYDLFPEYYFESRKHKEKYLIVVTICGRKFRCYRNTIIRDNDFESIVISRRKTGQVVYFCYDIDNIIK